MGEQNDRAEGKELDCFPPVVGDSGYEAGQLIHDKAHLAGDGGLFWGIERRALSGGLTALSVLLPFERTTFVP